MDTAVQFVNKRVQVTVESTFKLNASSESSMESEVLHQIEDLLKCYKLDHIIKVTGAQILD